MTKNLVLFVCVENACRSLMAEAMFNFDPPPGWRATSAGTQPAGSPNPRTGLMLQEIGLDVPRHPPQLLTPDLIEAARVCVTMGCLDDASCPVRLRALEPRDWGLADPAELDDTGFRRVRNDVARRVDSLKTELLLLDRPRSVRRPDAPV